MSKNRRLAVLSALTGGLLAALFLPMDVSAADEYDFTPGIIFSVDSVEGYPPLDNEFTSSDTDMDLFDLTQNTKTILSINGSDTETQIGSFTNDDFLNKADGSFGPSDFEVPAGTQIDLANFGGGFENEWIDIPANGTDPGVSDLFITPFGDFPLMGTFFADLSTAYPG
jgi:hypothetical protein